jgi:hypothetical protein
MAASRRAREPQRLRLHLDTKYPKMNREIGALLECCFLENTVGKVVPGPSGWSERSDSLLVFSVYSNHLSCLFPQHGPGRKHERRIELERWQTELVARAPWGLIRGLIRSDGCAFIDRTDVHRAKPYEYLSYDFSNKSKDIIDLFVDACDRVSVLHPRNPREDGALECADQSTRQCCAHGSARRTQGMNR